MPDKIQSQRVICENGLYTNDNNLLLSDKLPGSATKLVNYEVSLSGGYRRISGFSPYDSDYEIVDDENAEGRILGTFIFESASGSAQIFVARKQIVGNEYKWYKHLAGVGWVAQTTGLTLLFDDGVNEVLRIRHAKFNFGDGNQICLVDGINNATLFDGTSWINIDPTATGLDFDNAGGAQVIEQPSIVSVFENHLFLGRDIGFKSIICHSAPLAAYDFLAASGAGQIQAGFDVVQIKPFRTSNFVFGRNAIKKIEVDSASGDFTIDDVTTNIGCIAADSVVEVSGDLVFLAPDGFRPVAGTARIGDIEIESISRPIQLLVNNIIENEDLDNFIGLTVRKKSQIRFFYGENAIANSAYGVIGGLRLSDSSTSGVKWEWGQLKGISCSCATSEFVSGNELIVHGDYNGGVYRQESGTSFNNENITSIYSPPYLDQGDTEIRKTYRTLNIFVKAEGEFSMSVGTQLDWKDYRVLVPNDYVLNNGFGTPSIYDSGVVYDTTGIVYSGSNSPVIKTNIEGSGFSIRHSFVTIGQDPSHSIQGFVIEFTPEDRR